MREPIYLNNAGTSWPKAPGVVEACRGALEAPPAASQQLLADAYAETSRAFGLESEERLLLTGSCTAALSLLIQDFPLGEGDVVLTSALEHHALVRPIQQLSLTRAVVHEVVPYKPGIPCDLEHARRVLREGRTRLLAVTAASNVTGELLPIDELVRLAHEHDVPVLLDAAQTAGLMPLDVRQVPVDMLVFAAHKGPLAPHGIGGLWAAPHVRFQSPAALCELPAPAPAATATGPRCTSFPTACDVGSVNLAAAAGLLAALRWRREQRSEVFARPAALAARLRERLREQPGCRVLGGESAASTATVSFLLDALPLDRAEAHFSQRGISLRAGQHCAPLALQAVGAQEGTIRVSFGPFNQATDVDAVLAAVADAATGR